MANVVLPFPGGGVKQAAAASVVSNRLAGELPNLGFRSSFRFASVADTSTLALALLGDDEVLFKRISCSQCNSLVVSVLLRCVVHWSEATIDLVIKLGFRSRKCCT